MSNTILNLFMYGMVDLIGSPSLVGFIILIAFILLFAALGLPTLIIPIIMLGFVVGIVEYGWLPLWAEAVVILIVGAVFFYALVQLFRTN